MGEFCGFVLAACFFVLVGMGIQSCRDGHSLRSEAVEAGVAEWVVTGSDGKTEFRWKEVGLDERK